MKLLLRRGAILNIPDSDRDTLLHCAAWAGTPATVGLFLEAGMNIEATNNPGKTPPHCAATNGREECVEELLRWRANVHAIDNEGLTPLQAFLRLSPSTSADCQILHHGTLREGLVSKGAQAFVPARRFVEFDEPVADLLLSAEADIRASRNSTCSLLQWAIF
jgi:ankyrin repeat protein